MSWREFEDRQALRSVLALDPQRRISSLNEHLEACRELLRVPVYRSSATARQLDRQLKAFSAASTTGWLTGIGFPTAEPLSVDQPVTSHDCAVTFWRYLPQDGPEPGSADLGCLLRRLHRLTSPPVPLPAYRPLAGRAQNGLMSGMKE